MTKQDNDERNTTKKMDSINYSIRHNYDVRCLIKALNSLQINELTESANAHTHTHTHTRTQTHIYSFLNN